MQLFSGCSQSEDDSKPKFLSSIVVCPRFTRAFYGHVNASISDWLLIHIKLAFGLTRLICRRMQGCTFAWFSYDRRRGISEVVLVIWLFRSLPACSRISFSCVEPLNSHSLQMVSAHSSQVTALSFSPDDRVLASYSFGDSKICFWQVINNHWIKPVTFLER